MAFAFRCGMFNIGGQGQYLVGSFFAVWIGSSFSGLTPIVHVVLVIAIAMVAGAALGWDRRLPEGDHRGARGDLDDHAQLDRDLGGAVSLRPRWAVAELAGSLDPDLERHRRRGAAARLLGPRRLPGPLDRDLHRTRGARRLLDHPQPDDARLRRQGRRASTRRRPATAASTSRATTSWRWRSRACSRGSRERSTSSAGSSRHRDERHHGVADRLRRDRGRPARA